MEVRCGNCHKLFRVSDDKISGKGVKFVCTRCGVYVRITIEDFSTYTLSKSAVSPLDLFENKPRQATSEIGLTVAQTAEAATTPISTISGKTATEPTMGTTVNDFLKSPMSYFRLENEDTSLPDRSPLEEAVSRVKPIPERETEFPPQIEPESQKSDIAQSEEGKISESESDMTPASAVGENVHPAFEQQLELQTEPQTETLQMMVAPEAGIAAVSEALEAVQTPPEQKSEPQLKPDTETTVKDSITAAEPEPIVTITGEKTEVSQTEPEEPQEPQQELKTEMSEDPTAVPELQSDIASPSETSGTAHHKQNPEPEIGSAVMPASISPPETRPEPKPSAISNVGQQSVQKIPRFQTGPQAVHRSKPAGGPASQALKKESSHHPSPAFSPVIGASPTKSHRSGKRVMVMVAAAIILVLGGFGAYVFLQSPEQSSNDAAAHMISTGGLRITNAAGSLEPNGDLLISGVVENSTNKPRSAWLVVVDVYDARGMVINKIKLLDGKQLYSRSDYAILAKRGALVQQMKANVLQGQGTVIPPEDKVPFEIRYLQPPAGIASFNATLQPFDPARLSKEIEDQTK